MSKSSDAKGESQKSRWRFTLRELFLFSVAIATLLGWLIQVQASNKWIALSGIVHGLRDPFERFESGDNPPIARNSRLLWGGSGSISSRFPRYSCSWFETEFLNESVDQEQTIASFRTFLLDELRGREVEILAVNKTDPPTGAIAFTIHFGTEESRGIVAVHRQLCSDADDKVYFRMEERPK